MKKRIFLLTAVAVIALLLYAPVAIKIPIPHPLLPIKAPVKPSKTMTITKNLIPKVKIPLLQLTALTAKADPKLSKKLSTPKCPTLGKFGSW